MGTKSLSYPIASRIQYTIQTRFASGHTQLISIPGYSGLEFWKPNIPGNSM